MIDERALSGRIALPLSSFMIGDPLLRVMRPRTTPCEQQFICSDEEYCISDLFYPRSHAHAHSRFKKKEMRLGGQ